MSGFVAFFVNYKVGGVLHFCAAAKWAQYVAYPIHYDSHVFCVQKQPLQKMHYTPIIDL